MSYENDELQLKLNEANDQKDAYLLPENIRKDITVFGVTGSYDAGTKTDDATATAEDIRLGKTAYVKEEKITGTLDVLDTSDATALSSDILKGKTAYVDGKKVTGTIEAEFEDVLDISTEDTLTLGTAYYIYDYLPQIDIGIIGTSSNATEVYLCQFDKDQNKWLTSNWVPIAKPDNTNNIISCKFAGKPIIDGNVTGTYEYYILVNGQNAGSYDYHYFRGVRCRITFNAEKIASFALIYNYTVSQYHSWFTTGNTVYNICANPTSTDQFYYRITESIRQDTHGIIRAIVGNSTISFTEQNANGNNSTGNAWLQFSQDGRYVSYYVNGTTHVATIDTTTNNVVKTSLGMNAIVCRNNSYFIFRSNNIYTFSGTKLTDFTSSTFNFSYDYCAWLDENKLLLISSTTIKVYSFDDSWNFKLIKTIDLGTNGYNPTQYSYKYAKLGNYSYRDNMIIFESGTRGHIYILKSILGDMVEAFIVEDTYYTAGFQFNAVPENVLLNKTFLSQGIARTGTMPNNGALNYTPSEVAYTIPAGYTSGGTVRAADITKLKEYNNCLALSQKILDGDAFPYLKIDYVQSTGSQYLNTGIALFDNSNWKIELDIQPTAVNYDYNGIWGVASGSTTWECWINASAQCYSRYNGIKPSAISMNTSRVVYTDYYNGSSLITYKNGSQVRSFNVSQGLTSSVLYLFRCSGTNSKMKIYSAKLYKNNELIASYIPVLDNYGIPGLYDEINDKLHYSASGTFEVGGVS